MQKFIVVVLSYVKQLWMSFMWSAGALNASGSRDGANA
jgi:hypothetical protein